MTAGRVSGEKTLCQRYCEDSIAGRPSALARAWQAAGYAGQARPGYAGQLGPRSHSQKKKSVLQSSPHGRTRIFVTLVPPMSRKRGWASPFWASPYSLGEPSNEVGASHQTRLGRAIKRGWGEPSNEVGRAIKRGWGEPSNEVGASHQTRLGRAIKRGWASHQTRLGEPLNHSGLHACFKAAPWRYGASSALCPLGTSSACSARCLLGTFSARSALHPLHGASTGVPTFLQVPARHWGACSARARSAHLVTSARSALPVPARHVPARHI